MKYLPTGIDATILHEDVCRAVRQALDEDLGGGDVSAALIDDGTRARARVITREAGIFCGAPWVLETCRQTDPGLIVEFAVNDGDPVAPGDLLFSIEGQARALLTAERTMLNFVQLLSGTATQTRRYVELIAHTRAKLLDTRKTVPGLRLAQKYAVRCGGGSNHRIGLFDQYLIKENHIVAAGSIDRAVRLARQQHPQLKVEVEVETLEQLAQAIACSVDIAMVDNFSLAQTREAVKMASGKIILESSGGINEATIREIAETGVDHISLGALTKEVRPLDLSMRIESV